MDFAFTLCSTSLHGKTIAVRQLQKLKPDATCSQSKQKTDAIPISIFSKMCCSCQSGSVLCCWTHNVMLSCDSFRPLTLCALLIIHSEVQ